MGRKTAAVLREPQGSPERTGTGGWGLLVLGHLGNLTEVAQDSPGVLALKASLDGPRCLALGPGELVLFGSRFLAVLI